jgi:hypothetical protein
MDKDKVHKAHTEPRRCRVIAPLLPADQGGGAKRKRAEEEW